MITIFNITNIKSEIFLLDNGLTVILNRRSGSGLIAASLVGIAGSLLEAKSGVAHYLEHVVLDGTEKYPSKNMLLEVIGKAGGIGGGKTGKEVVEYYVKTVSKERDAALSYLSQVVFHSLIKKENVDKERTIISQEIRRAESDNSLMIREKSVEVLYKNERMKRMVGGSLEDIKMINREDLFRHHKQYYVPSNFVLSVCGDITLTEMKILAKKYFSNLDAGKRADVVELELEPVSDVRHFLNREVKQSLVRITFPAPRISSEKYYSAEVLSRVLGSGKSSRLFKKVREQEKLAYDIACTYFAGSSYGYFTIYAGVGSENVDRLVDIIHKELAEVVEHGVKNLELQQSISRLQAEYMFALESSLATASHCGRQYLLKESIDDGESFSSVLAGDVNELAKEMFSVKPSVVVLGSVEKKSL